MGQWDHFELATVSAERERSADNFVQFFEGKKLSDGKFAYRNDQLRSQQIDLVVHPGRTIPDFIRRRNAVSAGGRLPWKAAADRGEINLRAHLRLIQMTEFIEPAEERAAGRPCERPSQNRFSDPWRLPDQHDPAKNCSARDRWGQHSRTEPALAQPHNMPIELLLSER